MRYAKASGARCTIFRLKNVFGKWCRPNYNSVVATFCHNIAHDLPIAISDPGRDWNWCMWMMWWRHFRDQGSGVRDQGSG